MTIHFKGRNLAPKLKDAYRGKDLPCTKVSFGRDTDQTVGRPNLASLWVALGIAVQNPVKSPSVRNTVAMGLE